MLTCIIKQWRDLFFILFKFTMMIIHNLYNQSVLYGIIEVYKGTSF